MSIDFTKPLPCIPQNTRSEDSTLSDEEAVAWGRNLVERAAAARLRAAEEGANRGIIVVQHEAVELRTHEADT